MLIHTQFPMSLKENPKMVKIPEKEEYEFYRLKNRYDVAKDFYELTERELREFLERVDKER